MMEKNSGPRFGRKDAVQCARERLIDMDIHELWDEPWEGLPEEEAAWEWDFVSEEENGPTKNPPTKKRGWIRWYFIYHEPRCTNFKISADKDPATGKWFNPHRSSGTI
jgi:hypothetical protein